MDYQLRLKCGTPPASMALLLVNAASEFELFADGVTVGSGTDWTVSKELYVPADFQTLAARVRSSGDGSLAGLLVSMPTLGLLSDGSWKCSSDTASYGLSNEWLAPGFNDREWTEALGKGYVGERPVTHRCASATSVGRNRQPPSIRVAGLGLDVGCWLLAVGCWLLAVGCWILDVGCWVLDAGCWMLGVGCWVVGVRCWM
jgi:hypothetical protein